MYRSYEEVLAPDVLERIASKIDDAFGAMPYETVQHFGRETSYMIAERSPEMMAIAEDPSLFGISTLLYRSMNYQLGAGSKVRFFSSSDRHRLKPYRVEGDLAYRQRHIEFKSSSPILNGVIKLSDTRIEGDLHVAGKVIAIPPKSFVETDLYRLEGGYDDGPMAALKLDTNSGKLSGNIALQHHQQDDECLYPGSCFYESAAIELPFAWADPPLSEPEVLESILNRARSLTKCLDLLLPHTVQQG